MASNPMQVEFVFVHSYNSDAPNCRAVMQGDASRSGRLHTAGSWAYRLGVPVLANDWIEAGNHALYAREGVDNLTAALRTEDEVRSALAHSRTGRVLFVTSPDHLPRIAMELGGTSAIFAASEVPHSTAGAAGVMISEPSDLTQLAAPDGGQKSFANTGISCIAAPDDDLGTTE